MASSEQADLVEYAALRAAQLISERMLRTRLAVAGERLLLEPFSPAARRAMREALDEAIRAS